MLISVCGRPRPVPGEASIASTLRSAPRTLTTRRASYSWPHPSPTVGRMVATEYVAVYTPLENGVATTEVVVVVEVVAVDIRSSGSICIAVGNVVGFR